MKAEGGPPAHSLADVRRSLSGLEFFRQMMAGTIPPPPMVSLLELRMVEAEEGRVVFAGTAAEAFYNGMGVAHGGFVATLLDSALGCAIFSTIAKGEAWTTLELKFNLVRPLTKDTGPVRAEGRLIHRGRTVATAEGDLKDRAGKLFAHATTTTMIFPATS